MERFDRAGGRNVRLARSVSLPRVMCARPKVPRRAQRIGSSRPIRWSRVKATIVA